MPQNQWAWLDSHAAERAKQIDHLIDKISEFDRQYNTQRQFVEEGMQLCASEKPVGETVDRVKEQMEACQVCACMSVWRGCVSGVCVYECVAWVCACMSVWRGCVSGVCVYECVAWVCVRCVCV